MRVHLHLAAAMHGWSLRTDPRISGRVRPRIWAHASAIGVLHVISKLNVPCPGLTRKDNGLHFRIENPCLDLVLVGLVQGIFELVTGRDSEVDWGVSADGDLVVDVTSTA